MGFRDGRWTIILPSPSASEVTTPYGAITNMFIITIIFLSPPVQSRRQEN